MFHTPPHALICRAIAALTRRSFHVCRRMNVHIILCTNGRRRPSDRAYEVTDI
jgi:hypothetical protein